VAPSSSGNEEPRHSMSRSKFSFGLFALSVEWIEGFQIGRGVRAFTIVSFSMPTDEEPPRTGPLQV